MDLQRKEVKGFLPEAVDDTTDHLIPNIYKLGKVENDILTIEKEVEIDVEYTIYVKNGDDLESATKEEIKAVEKIENYTYRINKTYEGLKDVFVYGKIEKNLNSLKKEYFHALTISSVQELYKIIMEQKEEIDNLKNRLNLIEDLIRTLSSREESVPAQNNLPPIKKR